MEKVIAILLLVSAVLSAYAVASGGILFIG
jgi:predicted small secreted protein